MQLPEPTEDALIASRALTSLIHQEIQSRDGWISFTRFMQLALYAEGLGYYAGGSTKLGKEGDFTTAPEIAPIFGATLAQYVMQMADEEPLRILEFGAGSGKLARDVMNACQTAGKSVVEYVIVELSAQLRAKQQNLLQGFDCVRWLDVPPTAFRGTVLCNEVLDAMPVPLLIKKQGRWLERGVGWSDASFCFVDREAAQEIAQQIPDADALPDGYVTEVHPIQQGFTRSLSEMLIAGGRGSAVLIDYGFPAREYYLASRASGTLMCHYRHHAHGDPFYMLGLQDITAHVDFTAMALAAVEGGSQVLAYLHQAAFLIAAGLPELMQTLSPEDTQQWLPTANAVQQLTSPAEMGELFKVLIIGVGLDVTEAIVKLDKSHRL
jgi:SAM-dependent MidA family methyltransferase